MKEFEMKQFDTLESKLPSKIRIKKEYILILMLFLMFFSSSTLYNEEHLILYTGISLVICIYTFFRGLVKPSRISRTITNGFFVWLIVLYFMYFFYGIALPKYEHFSTKYFFFMFVMILITMLLFIDIPVKRMMEIFIKVCAFASIATIIFVLVNEWSLILSGGTRIGESGSGNVNTVAIRLGVMSIPCIYKFIFERKYIYLLPYGLSTIVMLLTGSKKALLFIIFGVIILSILKNRFKLYKYILPMLVSLVLFFLIFNNEYLYNIIGFRVIDFIGSLGFSIEGAGYSNSTHMRLMMYKLAYEAFMNKPIFGGGWFYFSAYSGLGTYSHNNYMELLVTYGVVGFSIYYSMFFAVLIKLKRITRVDNYAKLLLAILIIILINDFAAVSFSSNLFNYVILVFSYLYSKNFKFESNIIQGRRKNVS